MGFRSLHHDRSGAQRTGSIGAAVGIHGCEVGGLKGGDTATVVDVANDAPSQEFARHDTSDLIAFCATLPFISPKEKDSIFDDGATYRATESVAEQFSGAVFKSGCNLRPLVEPVICGSKGRAMIFIHRAVEIVGATLGHQIHLRPRRTAGIGIGIASGYAKFLQGIQSGAQGAFECRPLCLIVVVNAIQGDVGLVAAGAAHRPPAAVETLVNVAHENYSGLQAKNARRIAALERQSLNARGGYGVADGGILGVDGRYFTADLNRCSGLHLQRDVQSGGRAYDQSDGLFGGLSKARRGHGNVVSAGRDL